MNPRWLGVIAGLSGMLAAYIATQLVTWPTGAKALLAAVVGGTVTAALLIAMRKKLDR